MVTHFTSSWLMDSDLLHRQGLNEYFFNKCFERLGHSVLQHHNF